MRVRASLCFAFLGFSFFFIFLVFLFYFYLYFFVVSFWPHFVALFTKGAPEKRREARGPGELVSW